MRPQLAVLVFLILNALAPRALAVDAIWQWSVPTGPGRAYLWIPEDCARVRGIVLAQHNLIERIILEHPEFRATLGRLGFAEVFLVPSVDPVYRFDAGAVERFATILHALATESGYEEIGTAPVAPVGHSAHASFPWNYAAANPERTLAVLSIKGDAPLSPLTGSGRPNPDWGTRSLDGIPGLFVMSEQEWWEDRLAPLTRYRAAHPNTPLTVLADTGRGHFDATDSLIRFLGLFLQKATALRLSDGPLASVDPKQGWLVERWRVDAGPSAPPAPYADFAGDRSDAGWCADEEMARAIETIHAASRGKRSQAVAFEQNGRLRPIANTHAGTELDFLPADDGMTFQLTGNFITPLPADPPSATKDQRPPRLVREPLPADPDAHAPGPVRIVPLSGPVVADGPGRFRLRLDRMQSADDSRPLEAWFMALHDGDAVFAPTVRQARLRLPRHDEGLPQVISFPPLPDQRIGAAPTRLEADSDQGLPVEFYIRDGPATIRDGILTLAPVPPRTRLPAKVTVVAWQYGRATGQPIRQAAPVERTFLILPP